MRMRLQVYKAAEIDSRSGWKARCSWWRSSPKRDALWHSMQCHSSPFLCRRALICAIAPRDGKEADHCPLPWAITH